MIFLILTLLISLSIQKCTDHLSCFKKQLFNFDSPQIGVHSLSSITSDNSLSSTNILAYGDFNNDLHTDYVATVGSNVSLSLYLWSSDDSDFTPSQTFASDTCSIQSVILYDMDLNGELDVAIWGTNNSQNCLLTYLQTNSQYKSGPSLYNLGNTSNPFVIAYGNDNGPTKSIGLLAYLNNTRKLIRYSSATQFTFVNWTTLFTSATSYESIAFADPHWNSYLDLTGDCRADIVIVNSNNAVEYWINNNNTFYLQNQVQYGDFVSLSFADMNYDGSIDLLLATSSQVNIFYNKVALVGDFCPQANKTVGFYSQIGDTQTFNGIFKNSVLQIKDINKDGYPDLFVPLFSSVSSTEAVATIYLNNKDGFKQANQDDNKVYNDALSTKYQNLISVSFLDLLQNGIMDFIICTQNGTFAFYNNILNQSEFFIKGYAASGPSSQTKTGAQVVGGSFYWINSVGQKLRIAYHPQIIQTAYNALQTPFAYCGLGRANNYVQSFTFGALGQSRSWSPIIPNSQLAVYASNYTSENWPIRIYVLPKQSLVYVIIVSILILSILGCILAILRCKNYRKKDEPLMEFIH